MKILNYKTSRLDWALDYNESKVRSRVAARIGGNVAGKQKNIERVFRHVAQKRETANLKNRYMHMKISLSPKDTNVTSSLFRKVVKKVMKKMNLDNNPYLMYRHYDTMHQHVHVLASRINFDGELTRDSFDGLKLKRIEQEIEKEYGLIPAQTQLLTQAGVRLPKKWETERMHKTGTMSVRSQVQNAVIESLQGRPDLGVFVRRLERRGVKIWHRKTERGNNTYHGLSYTFDPSLVTISFQQTDLDALVGGITVENREQLLKGIQINHPYYGNASGQLNINFRGIPEYCLEPGKPAKKYKGYSFRAANLGPFFQFSSVMGQLSSVDGKTLEAITVKKKKRSAPTDYSRDLFTAGELAEQSKLILAAEMKSVTRVLEAAMNLKGSQVNVPENTCTEADKQFIQETIGETRFSQSQTTQTEAFDRVVMEYSKIASSVPNESTTHALKMMANGDWEGVRLMLLEAMNTNDRHGQPDPALMYMDVPIEFSFAFMEYQRWYQSGEIGTYEDEQSASRRRILQDTNELLLAFQRQDDSGVKAILENKTPDLSKIPVEYQAKIDNMGVRKKQHSSTTHPQKLKTQQPAKQHPTQEQQQNEGINQGPQLEI